MLGNDSGVMHLAVAVGTPVVAVFGPSDSRVYGPYGRHCRAVRHDAQCFGRCFAPGRAIAIRCDQQCIESVSADEVWAAVQAVLAERGAT
jgi:heptosyltransferase II